MNTACDASFLKHYHTPVIHFGTLNFKNEETLFYSARPISQYLSRSELLAEGSMGTKFHFGQNYDPEPQSSG